MVFRRSLKWAIPILLALTIAEGAEAQTTAAQVTPGSYASPGDPGCPSTSPVGCFIPYSVSNPQPTTAVVGSKTITWIAPTSASITASGTVVAAGPAVSVITNATASGGGILTLNLFGGTAVANIGVPLQPGQSATISGQPVGTAITGICSTGTCTVAIQSGT